MFDEQHLCFPSFFHNTFSLTRNCAQQQDAVQTIVTSLSLSVSRVWKEARARRRTRDDVTAAILYAVLEWMLVARAADLTDGVVTRLFEALDLALNGDGVRASLCLSLLVFLIELLLSLSCRALWMGLC